MVVDPGEKKSHQCIDDIEDLNFGDLERPQPRESVVPKVIRRNGIVAREKFSGDSFVPG